MGHLRNIQRNAALIVAAPKFGAGGNWNGSGVAGGNTPVSGDGLQSDDAPADTFLQSDDAPVDTVLTTDDNP